MSIRNFSSLLSPRSVALIGASDKMHSLGATVLHNLLSGGFEGEVFAVNPKHSTLAGRKCYHNVASLPVTPDLAVICTPAVTVPGIVKELGARGTRAAVVLSAGFGGADGGALRQAMQDAARPTLLRVLGPNCVGLLVPAIGLNASFAHTSALPGKVAFVSQSGALVTGVLDWAKSRGIGFSRFISLGDSADIDSGDVLDYLAGDSATQAILMYIEDVRDARKFMSAARAAARSKPVLLVKAGRAPEGAKAAASHSGALAGSDAVFDAAIRRAGMLRVTTTEDLFDAAETLANARPLSGERLAILTNGGGLGVMATDALMAGGGRLAQLSPDSLARLDAALPANWSHANPVDIIGDAPVERYRAALEVLLAERECDAILFIHAPTAIVDSIDIARALAPLVQAGTRQVFSCWFGGDAVAPARQLFSKAGIPTYDTPEDAVCAFMQIVQYRRNQNLLMQVPPSLPASAVPDRASARAIVDAALAGGRAMLSEPEAKQLLAAYGIAIADTRVAASTAEAQALAREIGFPVALKILSPDITHKSDVGGVALNLDSADAVQAAATAMLQRVQTQVPGARQVGLTVQAMVRRPGAHELIVGVATDRVFGPVILVGHGGVAVEVMDDHAIGLPPLNMVLARDMIAHTRVARLLDGYRGRPPADLDAICRTLVQVSQLVVDLPELIELDINPLLADSGGVIALDARIRLASADGARGRARLAIRPYPAELEQSLTWQGQPLQLRPVKPEDGPAHDAFFHRLDVQDVRFRAFGALRELQPAQLARLTQIDYDREMAFIATRTGTDGAAETLGVARAIADPDNLEAEFAVIVRSDLKGQGLGALLMRTLIDYFRKRKTGALVGEALSDNADMLGMASHLGFALDRELDSETTRLRLPL